MARCFKLASNRILWVWDEDKRESYWINRLDGSFHEYSGFTLEGVLRGPGTCKEIPFPSEFIDVGL